MSTTSQITSARKTLRTALMAAQGIALLRGVLDDAASRAVLTLLAALAGPDPADAPVAGAFGRAFGQLAAVADEEHETQYKALKALLEGTAEARPANLLIYATTNRRNLVRESFADRGAPGEDVHGRDTMQEKISLAARFGLRVTFAAPDQERYLAIATSLARGRGLPLADEEVRARALLWERQHPGRSGRTARQFVDDLEAEVHTQPSYVCSRP